MTEALKAAWGELQEAMFIMRRVRQQERLAVLTYAHGCALALVEQLEKEREDEQAHHGAGED